MAQRARLSTGLSGVAGEYFVAAELSRRGYIASITLRNTRGIDILASDADATKSVGIQVKTNQNSGKEWMLSNKIEEEDQSKSKNLFYVFVRLNGMGEPEYYIVPRKVVVKFAAENHQKWLATPGRKGQAHVDTPMRKFWDSSNKYKNRWELLGLGDPAV
jgi:Holliday junction resolvase-like predicted endonuclease